MDFQLKLFEILALMFFASLGNENCNECAAIHLSRPFCISSQYDGPSQCYQLNSQTQQALVYSALYWTRMQILSISLRN